MSLFWGVAIYSPRAVTMNKTWTKFAQGLILPWMSLWIQNLIAIIPNPDKYVQIFSPILKFVHKTRFWSRKRKIPNEKSNYSTLAHLSWTCAFSYWHPEHPLSPTHSNWVSGPSMKVHHNEPHIFDSWLLKMINVVCFISRLEILQGKNTRGICCLSLLANRFVVVGWLILRILTIPWEFVLC